MNRSKSTLQLIEQIIVIAVFAVCAAVCVNIIATSYLMTARAVDTRNALSVAETAAEGFKAVGGNMDDVRLFFDEDWLPAEADEAAFVLELTRTQGELVIFADIRVTRADGEYLLSLQTAARGFLHE